LEEHMQARICWAAMLALTCLLVGCQPAPPPAAPDNRAADAAAIRTAEAAGVQAFASKDPAKVGASYAGDASLFMPDAPVIHGRPAIEAALKPMLEDKNFSLTFASDKAEAARSGELAYSQGAYTMTMTAPKSKKVLTETGKYVTVFEKQAGGGWQAVADIFNEDAPPAPMK
jgi:uncharacterized protein (TIGR02246 family)